MARIYIAFADTPGIFACMIHRFLKQKYIHVALSMDSELEETYSIGRRNPFIPFFAGFERENKQQISQAFPTADYMICELSCTPEQKNALRERLEADYENRFHYHYTLLGLPFLVCGKPFFQRNHYTCSSYIARILEEQGIQISEKHFSLVTPKDFYEYKDKKIIFQGALSEIADAPLGLRHTGAAYEH